MNKAFKIILPILLALIIMGSIAWYLLVYDTGFTQDMLLNQARRFEENGNHAAAVWVYNLAYSHSGEDGNVAIELANQYKSIGNYTKAEYTLSKAIADSGSTELYVELCKTYVEQDKGQYEAGYVLGLTKSQIFRKIILKQVVQRIVPPMSNEIITLIKDTALANCIMVCEIIKNAKELAATKAMIWPLFFTGVFYLVFVGILTIVLNKAEKKLSYFRS